MILSKLIFSFLIILSISSLFKLKYSEALRINEKLILILTLILSLIIIIEPSLLKIANSIFKLRGRAIIIYLYIIFSSWSIFRNHLRINQLNQKINKLVSEISILKS